MTKSSHPTPPDSDNPIVVLRELSLDKELTFLEDLLAAHAAGNVDRAAKCVITALSTSMERRTVNAMVSVVSNLAHADDCYPPSVKALLCKATDLGFHEHAYNAANQVMVGAKGIKGFKEAERYFKLAMAYPGNPALQAAAHVNYCPIVRDGLISGTPDWPAAVELYETAARMGLVKAMFNAGNVSSWLANKGDKAYGARAAYWFRYALDVQAARTPTLDMETPKELEEVFETCALGLSAMHIDARFEEAQLDEGIRWARRLAKQGNPQAQHNLGVAYTRRIVHLTAKPQRLPGLNWRSVLSQMDWRFKGDVAAASVSLATGSGKRMATPLDRLTVLLDDETEVPLFVTHDPCLPLKGGLELLEAIADALAERHSTFFLLTRKAVFIEADRESYTPIYVVQNQELSQQVLWVGGSPDLVLRHAKDGVDFQDQRYGTWHCMVPIAVNALDEGFVVADDASYGQPWVGVGGPWRMPFVDKGRLAELGL